MFGYLYTFSNLAHINLIFMLTTHCNGASSYIIILWTQQNGKFQSQISQLPPIDYEFFDVEKLTITTVPDVFPKESLGAPNIVEE